MERLRDKRPVRGSVEEILVDAVRACGRMQPSPVIQRRVFARVLDVSLGRCPKLSHRRRSRPKIAFVLLLLVGLTLASTIGHRWVGRPGPSLVDPSGRLSCGTSHRLVQAVLSD